MRPDDPLLDLLHEVSNLLCVNACLQAAVYHPDHRDAIPALMPSFLRLIRQVHEKAEVFETRSNSVGENTAWTH